MSRLIVGIDPSLRHTGLCFLTEAGPEFLEIRPVGDVLTSAKETKIKVWHEIANRRQVNSRELVVSMEKQLSVGGSSSSLLFHVQMQIFEGFEMLEPFKFVNPLPIQLQSYMKKIHGAPTKSATEIVAHFRKTQNHQMRISQHCVDAYYLARLAQDVLERKWRYNLPTSEQPLHPWKTLNGDEEQPPRAGPQ